MVMSIRYDETIVRVDGQWRFAERKLIIDWTDSRPSAAEPAEPAAQSIQRTMPVKSCSTAATPARTAAPQRSAVNDSGS